MPDEKTPPSEPTPPSEQPSIDFTTFLLSLGSSALVHLGDVPHPEGGTKIDLVLAKQTIDLVALLETKTKGNLTEGEARFLESLLYDLRLRYVQKAQAPKP